MSVHVIVLELLHLLLARAGRGARGGHTVVDEDVFSGGRHVANSVRRWPGAPLSTCRDVRAATQLKMCVVS